MTTPMVGDSAWRKPALILAVALRQCTRRAVGLLLALTLSGCGGGTDGGNPQGGAQAPPPREPVAGAEPVEGKLAFRLDGLDSAGLQGPPDGKRALHYEFCVPADTALIGQAVAIDTTLTIYFGSPGRVGCDKDEVLCVGHTHQANYQDVLERLQALDFIAVIRESHFE